MRDLLILTLAVAVVSCSTVVAHSQAPGGNPTGGILGTTQTGTGGVRGGLGRGSATGGISGTTQAGTSGFRGGGSATGGISGTTQAGTGGVRGGGSATGGISGTTQAGTGGVRGGGSATGGISGTTQAGLVALGMAWTGGVRPVASLARPRPGPVAYNSLGANTGGINDRNHLFWRGFNKLA